MKEQIENAMKKDNKRVEKQKDKDGIYSSDSDEQEDKEDVEKAQFQNQNLRNREDTAKYLRNLDPNSAPYDPKSRSMKTNPNPLARDPNFKGDDFIKLSGDYINLIQSEGFMVDVNKKAEELGTGLYANHVAMPSQFEVIKREFLKQKDSMKDEKVKAVLDKYGATDNQKMPKELMDQLQTQF